MTKFSVRKLMQGSALAALAVLGVVTVASAADSGQTSAAAPAVAADAASKVSAIELGKFIKSLLPEMQVVMHKLSKSEQVKVYLGAKSKIAIALSSEAFKQSLEGKSAAQKAAAKARLPSEVVYYLADEKYNYCNVMLDGEALVAYDEQGVKRLDALKPACPAYVSMEKTLAYVNKQLACLIGDPAYTRVMPADEAADFRQEVAGTKAAFDGGGIGMILAADPAHTLPLTADEQAEFDAAHAKYLANPPVSSGEDECTGKPIPLTAKEKADNAANWAEGPHKLAFSGVIEHVMKGSPAEKAGIVDGDVIVKVDGKPVNDLLFNAVVAKMLRGPVGSTVKLTLARDETKEYAITRQVILPDNVWSRDLGDGIYSIVISNFERQNTGFAILDEMRKLHDKARAYAFDVRTNGGGLVNAGVEAVSWLIHDGVIFSQREREPGDPAHPKYIKITWKRVGSEVVIETVDDATHRLLKKQVLAIPDVHGKPNAVTTNLPFLGDKPMAVLVDGGCASACEIFAGGVGENFIAAKAGAHGKNASQGAKIIGVQTYGKFIGQQLGSGPEGTVIKATIFRYFTPRGEWLGDAWKTKIGLTPDIKVVQPKDAVPYTDSDVQLKATKAYLLSVLNGTTAAAQAH